MLSRIARGSRQIIRAAFDGEPEGDVTVHVTAADGTDVVAAGAAAEDGEYELSPSHTAELGRLTATWKDGTGDEAATVVTAHDVVGFHLITLDGLRKVEPLDDTDTYSDEDLELGRDIASYALERACNRAFTPQLSEETVVGEGSRFLRVAAGASAQVLSIDDGSGPLDLSTISPDTAAGFLERPRGTWQRGGAYVVSYIHGEEAVDPRVSRAVGLIAADILFEDALDGAGSAISPRATSQSTEDGTFSLVTAGIGANAFSLPEVNAVVAEWRLPS